MEGWELLFLGYHSFPVFLEGEDAQLWSENTLNISDWTHHIAKINRRIPRKLVEFKPSS